MRTRLLGGAVAALAVLGISLTTLGPASADPPAPATGPTWFTADLPGPSGDPLPGVIESRRTSFDANAAVSTLVSAADVATARQGQYVTATPQSDVVLELFDGREVPFEINSLSLRMPYDNASTKPHIDAGGSYSVGGAESATAALTFIPDSSGSYHLNGSINDPEYGNITVTRLTGNTYQLDQVAEPAEVNPGSGDGVMVTPTGPPPASDSIPTSIQVIDVLVAYANGNSPNIEAEINTRIQETNQALERSQVMLRLNILEIRPVAYWQNSTDMGADLSAARTSANGLAELNTRRDQIGADLVTLIVPNSTNACGIAWLPGYGASYGFSVTAKACMNGYTLSHELGHNLGANHNPEAVPNAYPYTYSHGKAVPGVVRSIMAYECSPGCARVLNFSNPSVPFINHPTIPSGDAVTMNNARSMNNYATSIAAYRARVIAHDVPQTHPFFTEIMWVIGNGISTGYGDGTYRPYDSVNRDAMAAFLYRFAGSPAYTPPAVSPFLDVPTTNMYYKEITWLASKGISTGYVVAGGKEFRPLQPVNRDAMAAFLYRYAGSPAYTPPAVSPFSDVPTSDLYYKEITWLNSTGITTGYSDGTYRRLTPVAREAMAVFMYRYRHTIG